MPTTAEPTPAPKDVDADSTPQELDAAGIYELEVGSDETTWGRVYADDAGQFNFSGPRKDLVEEMVRFYAKMYGEHLSEFGADEAEFTPNAVLAFMDARMNGRTWARVPGSAGEGAEPEDDDPEGDDEDEDSTPLEPTGNEPEPTGEVEVRESFTPAPDPEWEEATFNRGEAAFNEVRHAPPGSPQGGQFVSQGGGGGGKGAGHKPKGHREKAKLGGHDVTLEHQGDGSAKVVDGPDHLKGKELRKKAPPSPPPAKAEAKPEPRPAPKPATPAKAKADLSSPEAAEAHFEKEHKTRLKNGGLPEAKFLEQSKAVDAEMNRMKDEFKAVADTVKKRPSSGRELELGTDFASETGSAAGAASAYKFGTGVRIGKDGVFDPKAVPRFGGHTVGEDAGSQFRHEFGHEVYNEGFSGAKRASWEKAAGKFVGTATVSRYGGTNPSELFSESFSAYTSPNYRLGSLPKEIEGWLDEHVKGRKKAGPTGNAYRWETRDDGRLVLNGGVVGG